MKSKNLFIGLAVASVLIHLSCENEKISPDNQFPGDNQGVTNESITVLGKQLENPYTLANMKNAYSNLKSTNSEIPDVNIEASHYYIRFLPKNEEEFDVLKEDTSLILYDIPLDFEIEVQGVYYRDPELPDTSITWQYCAVTTDKKLPDIYYEKLADLYIPPFEDNGEDDEGLKSANALTTFYECLEDEALRITGNLDEIELKNTDATEFRRKWRPSGRITVYNSVTKSYVPVQGVVVRARRWFITKKGTTNDQGYYSCNGRFRRPANYSLKWETYHFSIRSDKYGQAKLDGPKRKGKWNRNIFEGRSRYYAIIFRAARYYYYDDIDGLKRPPKNSLFKPQLKIAAIYKSNKYHGLCTPWKRVLGVGNWIKIWNPEHRCDEIYEAVMHELGHASHWDMDHNAYTYGGDSRLKESWAAGIVWCLTRKEYPEYHFEYGRIYTGIVEDMVDDVEEDSYDCVSGYTMKELEAAIKGVRRWEDWRDRIKEDYKNDTEEKLEDLFSFWKSYGIIKIKVPM